MSDTEALELRVGQALKARGWTLAVGESCTGGLLSHRLTQVPGSSEYFLGGVVAYSNSAKQALLGVDELTLTEHGAVSAETAKEMARGARSAFLVHVGLSVTGIAGPDGGTPDKPVGLTYVGVVTPVGERVERFMWPGDREANKQASAEAALDLLLKAVG
jgi:nicotinamide-nucleotide amidase